MARKKSPKSSSVSVESEERSLNVEAEASGETIQIAETNDPEIEAAAEDLIDSAELETSPSDTDTDGAVEATTAEGENAATGEPETPMPSLASNISDEELARISSALIFASTKPLSASKLAELLTQSPGRIRSALAALDEKLRNAGAPFKLAEIAGGFRYMTDETVTKFVAALRGEQKKERLSAAALETLAIIAYRQPVSKGEIEAMRGVQAGPMLRMLLEKRLIRITGRAQVPGRPLQYGTTKEFLDKFNLASLKDLPTVEELAKP